MRKYLFILFFATTALTSCQSSNQNTPLVIEGNFDKIDTIKYNENLKREISIINTNSSDVKVLNILVSCGCTVVTKFEPEKLAKNKKLTFYVNYKPEPTDSANVSKSILIYTDGDPKLYTVEFKAFVKK